MRTLILLLGLIVLCVLSGCGDQAGPEGSSERTTAQRDEARTVGNADAGSQVLIPQIWIDWALSWIDALASEEDGERSLGRVWLLRPELPVFHTLLHGIPSGGVEHVQKTLRAWLEEDAARFRFIDPHLLLSDGRGRVLIPDVPRETRSGDAARLPGVWRDRSLRLELRDDGSFLLRHKSARHEDAMRGRWEFAYGYVWTLGTHLGGHGGMGFLARWSLSGETLELNKAGADHSLRRE